MEPWYRIINNEIMFYRTFEEYIRDIHDEITENDADVTYPQTFALESGEMVRMQPSVEQQVISRLEKEEFWFRQIDRAEQRKKRFLEAIQQLTENEQELVLSSDYVPTKLLIKIYRIYESQRASIDKELKKEYMQQFRTGVVVPC